MRIKRWIRALAWMGGLMIGAQAQAQSWPVQPCDVDDYITKAIGIEEPWLENAAYLFAQANTNGSPGSLTLSPEIEGQFSERVGMELDLPAYTANTPLGSGQSAFGPVAAGLKLAALHTCDLTEGRASLLTAEVEGQYWANPRPSVLPGQGNAVTAQVMWAQLWYPWFTQGEAGYTQRIGTGITSGWFVNTSVGHAIGATYAAQLEVEVDDQLMLDNGQRGLEGSVMPQFAYHLTQQWLLAIGEQASFQQVTSHPNWSTWLMSERDF
ncbi:MULTISPECIES: hypothetical protein [unclassified Thiomonas]|uniref:hypothetical protein n=1 Tax=unclassified Thiomonas TaxID=2625466 RepID=UPI0004DBC558|nr:MULTISPECIES: hypothetical protein [unclassified Thiomonas]CQR44788.1 conserved exported hypothetical protein [Thiomonas sp. CB3]VDY05743.1 conserved exported protein of unknown function [Thiomonas sp. Bio17B3]CDW92560.1 conserved exported hypothetical protein [Thiomonas sp. CB2]VDY06643.1 conserved exported protein of unknown function [Thiomonas sp. Bio17B3]VDY10061.1 conserved exported protein of unknown function [Thiomonas sp. Sup16B3]